MADDPRDRAPDRIIPPPSPVLWSKFVFWLGSAASLAEECAQDLGEPLNLMTPRIVLIGLMEFLKAEENLKETGADELLLPLLVAITELSEGLKPPLLRTQARAGKPSKGYAAGFDIGIVARALEELIKSGEPPESAETKVLAALKRGYPELAKRITRSTIRNWRYRCKEGQGAIDKHILANFLADLPPQFGNTSTDRARELLTFLGSPPPKKK